jgi:hypothetical protein
MVSPLSGIIDFWGTTLHSNLLAEEMKLLWQLTGKNNSKYNYPGTHGTEYLNGRVWYRKLTLFIFNEPFLNLYCWSFNDILQIVKKI